MKIIAVIPARYESSRFQGKPLAEICGKLMIERVYNQAKKVAEFDAVYVATDDERIYNACMERDVQAIMTSTSHRTGTDRIGEVAEKIKADLYVNIQGDEPLIEPDLIDALAVASEEEPELQMATVKSPMSDENEMRNPNNVKVVTDKKGYALYFSRSLLPYPRENTGVTVYKHIGIYAYRRDFLLQYARMEPTALEQTESLEQLRALENGYKIKVIATDFRFVGVDTPEDLAEVNRLYEERL